MAWVNLPDNEATTFVSFNPGDFFTTPLDKGSTIEVPESQFGGVFSWYSGSADPKGIGYVVSPATEMFDFADTALIPSGGMTGRRFRARVLIAQNNSDDPEMNLVIRFYPGFLYAPESFYFERSVDLDFGQVIVPANTSIFEPTEWVEFPVLGPEADGGEVGFHEWYGVGTRATSIDPSLTSPTSFLVEWQVWVEEETYPLSEPEKVYELDRGWGFDGSYIPHFMETNWHFSGNPFDNKQVQKIRIHGLSKGRTKLWVYQNSMEADRLSYDQYYTEPQIIDFPENDKLVTEEFMPVTNYVDGENRGVGIQFKFEGRTEDLDKPEPPHVLQVLSLQETTSGHREN